MDEHFELSRKDFRYVYRHLTSDLPKLLSEKDPKVDIQMMARILSCCGKNLIIDRLTYFWPEAQDYISIDQAYSLYLRYDSPPLVVELTKEDEDVFKRIKPELIFECLRNSGFGDSIPGIQQYLYEKNLLNRDHFDVSAFLQQAQQTRLELLKDILRSRSRENSPIVRTKDQILNMRKAFGFFITTPNLVSVQITVQTKKIIRGNVSLRLGRNSDMIFTQGKHPYDYDVIALVVSETDELLGITRTILENETYSTDEINLEPNCKIIVLSLGTTLIPRRRGASAELHNENGRLTKNFKMVLMNIFDFFDFDGNGLLCYEEFNTFLSVSGDETMKSQQDWNDILEMFDSRDNSLTVAGFIELQQMEFNVGEENAIADTYTSLRHLGYTEDLKLLHGCPYIIEVSSRDSFELEAKAVGLDMTDRNKILRLIHQLGTLDSRSELPLRVLQTSYFGMGVVKRDDLVENDLYEIIVDREHNVKLSFIEGKHDIRPLNSTTDWVLFLAYSITEEDYTIDFYVRKQSPDSTGKS